MSTLWTPGGEVPVDDGRTGAAGGDAAGGVSRDALSDAMDAAGVSLADLDLDSLSPEERAQAEAYVREMAESRERLKSVPAAVVIANHAMGVYELAALHLASQPPNFAEATVAIDALGVLLDGMQGRFGESEPTLREARSQLQMAFVQLKNSADSQPAPRPSTPGEADTGADPVDDSDPA